MKWSYPIGKLFGIPIRVHALFIALIAIFAAEAYFHDNGGWAAAQSTAVFLCLLFACVLIHELGHSLVARHYGVGVRDITLLPIGGLARLDDIPESPSAELRIAIVGPLINLGIAMILFPILLATTRMGDLSKPDVPFIPSFVFELMRANIILAVFNLLPAIPMDGGRVLRSILARRRGFLRATEIAVNVSAVMCVLMGLAGVIKDSWSLTAIAVIIYFFGKQELLATRLRHAAPSHFPTQESRRPAPPPWPPEQQPAVQKARDLEAARAFELLLKEYEAIRRHQTANPPSDPNERENPR